MCHIQRREFMAAGLVATTSALAAAGRAAADDPPPRPIRGKEGASILGPANPPREAQGRDRLAPPATDHGTVPNLKWTRSRSRPREGGSGSSILRCL